MHMLIFFPYNVTVVLESVAMKDEVDFAQCD